MKYKETKKMLKELALLVGVGIATIVLFCTLNELIK